jgi:hypothetical protein
MAWAEGCEGDSLCSWERDAVFMGGGGKQDGGGIDLFIFLFPEQNTALGGSRTPCFKDMKLLLSKNGGHSVNKSLHD